jgi:hypothetical protein
MKEKTRELGKTVCKLATKEREILITFILMSLHQYAGSVISWLKEEILLES